MHRRILDEHADEDGFGPACHAAKDIARSVHLSAGNRACASRARVTGKDSLESVTSRREPTTGVAYHLPVTEPDEVLDEVRRLRSLLRRIYPHVMPTPGTDELQAELEREFLVWWPSRTRRYRRAVLPQQ
jgi:hypothetical protein